MRFFLSRHQDNQKSTLKLPKSPFLLSKLESKDLDSDLIEFGNLLGQIENREMTQNTIL